jgi:flavodoxin
MSSLTTPPETNVDKRILSPKELAKVAQDETKAASKKKHDDHKKQKEKEKREAEIIKRETRPKKTGKFEF